MVQSVNWPNPNVNSTDNLCQLLRNLTEYQKVLNSRKEPKLERLEEIEEFLNKFRKNIKIMERKIQNEPENKEKNTYLKLVRYIKKEFEERNTRGLFFSYFEAWEDADRNETRILPAERGCRFKAGDVFEDLAGNMIKTMGETCGQNLDWDVS